MSLASLGSDGRADMAGMQEWSRLLADLIAAFQDLKGTNRKAGRDFVRVQEETGCGEMTSKWRSRLRVEIGKKFFPVRVVRCWHKLPSQAVDAPSLEALKARLDGAVSNLGYSKGLIPDDLQDLLQPKLFHRSIFLCFGQDFGSSL